MKRKQKPWPDCVTSACEATFLAEGHVGPPWTDDDVVALAIGIGVSVGISIVVGVSEIGDAIVIDVSTWVPGSTLDIIRNSIRVAVACISVIRVKR